MRHNKTSLSLPATKGSVSYFDHSELSVGYFMKKKNLYSYQISWRIMCSVLNSKHTCCKAYIYRNSCQRSLRSMMYTCNTISRFKLSNCEYYPNIQFSLFPFSILLILLYKTERMHNTNYFCFFYYWSICYSSFTKIFKSETDGSSEQNIIWWNVAELSILPYVRIFIFPTILLWPNTFDNVIHVRKLRYGKFVIGIIFKEF